MTRVSLAILVSWIALTAANAQERGALDVRSEPPGAEVFIDGGKAGITPVGLELAPGEHRLKVAKAGYEAHEATIRIAANQASRVDLRFAPADAKAERTVVQVTVRPLSGACSSPVLRTNRSCSTARRGIGLDPP